jgi:hypothetical protein
MEPVVYDFAINERGTWADLLTGDDALMPAGYYRFTMPALLRMDRQRTRPPRLAELDQFAAACRTRPELAGHGARRSSIRSLPAWRRGLRQPRVAGSLLAKRLRPRDATSRSARTSRRAASASPRTACPPTGHRGRPRRRPHRHPAGSSGKTPRIGLAALAKTARSPWSPWPPARARAGPRAPAWSRRCIRSASSAAATARSSKPTSPRAASTGRLCGTPLPHIFTTSYLSHEPPARFSTQHDGFSATKDRCCSPKASRSACAPSRPCATCASPGRKCPSRRSTNQQQKVRDSLRAALIGWAQSTGEAADYTDNLPLQCLHPVGHWYEVPNLLRNGTLAGC